MTEAMPASGVPAGGRPLTREDTAALLEDRGTPPDAFHLFGAHLEDAVVLDHRADGWVVFHSERGGENGRRRHATEDEACRDLLTRLASTAGPRAVRPLDAAADSPRLGTTSYLVLGLLAANGPLTPYELKAKVSGSVGYFWAFPHSQLYVEPPRLVSLGLAEEEREEVGRRRRRFRITDAGREAVAAWVAEPVEEHTQIRDLALLKLFFGELVAPAQIVRLARSREAAHRERLAVYEQIEAALRPAGPSARHQLATVRLGLAYERSAIDFWAGVAAEWQRDFAGPESSEPAAPGRRRSSGPPR